MKPNFAILRGNFSPAPTVLRAALFREIGWEDLTENKAYWDTCAIRMSLALIKSGMTIPGRMPIKSGSHKGKLIEPGQAKLSAILARPGFLGQPEKFRTADAEAGIGLRSGIVSFFDIDPPSATQHGHIDLVRPENNFRRCSSSCFWAASKVWFWEL